MIIPDDWDIVDAVSGLYITVLVGERLNRLCVEHMTSKPPKGTCRHIRHFFFTKDGRFNGTGTALCPEGEKP